MIRPDPGRKQFLYRGGGGSLKKTSTEIEKKEMLGGIILLI